MRIRSAGATALYLLLLLASLLEAAGHELLCRDEPAFSGIGAGVPVSAAQIDPGEEEHGDDCPCCGLCVPRISLAPSSSTEPTLALAEIQAAGHGDLLTKSLPASHLSRGPPVR